MLSNMAKGIDVNGQVEFEKAPTLFLNNLSEIKDYELAAQRISEEIQRAKDIGGVQFAEKIAANVRKINPNITNMFNSNFQSEQGMYDAINSDNPFVINYMPDSTMPPAVPSVGSTDDQMEDWVTAANKYSTGEGKYSNVVSNWWEGQKEKPYIRDIERYYESPGTTPFQIKQRQQAFDDALKGLGITEEEAEKYRIGQ